MANKIISCEVMKEELLLIKPKTSTEYEFVPMEFHKYPDKLGNELQSIIDRSKGFTSIILGFGLCGGAARNLKASEIPLIIPRVHDCIPILLGSKEEYDHQREKEKGTFYLSCGWMISQKDIITEHQRIVDKYGKEKALKVLDRMYDSYRRILFIHTGRIYEDKPISKARQIADLLDLTYEDIEGKNDYLTKIVNGPWDKEGFAKVPPFGVVEDELFQGLQKIW